ncbi:CaiB/BaiF CoA transferase family protein [Plastoroseomonas hellenica]|uniref:CaiB/BaiF CoA transferase family protein n=1 Tax=Plastoroseomonas hellenica TaxID=2687306 RepID=UPI001BAA5D42|nr:CoA transferase [Plastoroseomonas hellenica]MBR0646302.1 CoA transferase [Plastoroseomonas hellenica]
MGGILAGIRVVELGQVLAGPFAGAIFADLGADVIKVEKPEGGDDARQMGPAFRHGDALNFHEFNRGKRSVALDLKSPEAVEQLHALLAGADIMLHNLRPGAAEALGIGPEAVCARHPRLIYCAMSAFGHRGPMRLRPGYEPLLQAFGGLSSITGEPGGPPVRMGASVVDQGTGMWTVIGALAMLQHRHATGRGGVVNTSLFETALLWAGQKISAYVNQGKSPERHASGHPNFVPYQAFEAADGPLLVCCGNDRLFAKLAIELGQPGWPADPRFATNRARLQNQEALLPMVAEALAGAPRTVWLERLMRAGVPCAPVNTVPEVLAEPQTEALGMLQPVPGEDFALVGLPVSFDGARPAIARPAPRLGEHNAELLGHPAR